MCLVTRIQTAGLRFVYALLLALCPVALAESPPQDFESLPALTAVNVSDSVLLGVTRAEGRLVAVGERGIIVYSSDAGSTWRQAQVPVSNTLTAVTFVDARRGWAVGHGGIILHSDDGGQTWRTQFDGNEANRQWLAFVTGRKAELESELAALLASGSPDPDVADDLRYRLEEAEYAVEDAQLAIDNGPVDPFLAVWFADANFGIAVGAYGMLYRTEDGGRHWQLTAGGISNPYRYHYYDIDADSQGHLFISGEAGLMYRSRDGGLNWQRLGPFYDGSLFGVVIGKDALLTFGLRGNIFRSVDGGDHWQELAPAEFSVYGGVRLGDDKVALVGAGGGYALSQDGRHFVSAVHDSRGSFSAVSRDGKGHMVAVGLSGVVHLQQEAKP